MTFIAVVAGATGAMGAASAVGLREYTAETRFRIDSPDILAPGTLIPEEQSLRPRAYAELAESDEVLVRLAGLQMANHSLEPNSAEPVSVATLLGCPSNPRHKRLKCAVRRLRKRISTDVSPAIAAVTVQLRYAEPRTAETLLRHLVELVGEFEDARRRNARSALGRFLRAQGLLAQESLGEAEKLRADFLVENRTGRWSPRLSALEAVLAREVDRRESFNEALLLADARERLGEARSTAALWVLDPPEGSSQPTRDPPLSAAGGLALGLCWGVGLALVYGREGKLDARRQGHTTSIRENLHRPPTADGP